MTDVKVSVWLRWETCYNLLYLSLCEILLDNLFNEIL